MTAPRRGLTVGTPPQEPSDFAPYAEFGREAGPSWTPPNGGDPHVYTETVGARNAITVARPNSIGGNNTPIVPSAPALIQSVAARNNDMADRTPAVQRSADGVRPVDAPAHFAAGMADVEGR